MSLDAVLREIDTQLADRPKARIRARQQAKRGHWRLNRHGEFVDQDSGITLFRLCGWARNTTREEEQDPP